MTIKLKSTLTLVLSALIVTYPDVLAVGFTAVEIEEPDRDRGELQLKVFACAITLNCLQLTQQYQHTAIRFVLARVLIIEVLLTVNYIFCTIIQVIFTNIFISLGDCITRRSFWQMRCGGFSEISVCT
jgi:hypothetical protein